MKQIPLVLKNNQLLLWGRINGSINIQFILDTGCSSTLLSKEVGDILFLKGNLGKSDIKGTLASSYGGVYTAQQKEINIRNLTLGKIKLKNVEASICDRYGGPCLLGMSALDKLDGYSITKDKLMIDDGKSEMITTTGKVEDHKPNKTRFKGCIKRIRKIREESGTEDYKFDYAKHVMLIYNPIQSCYPLLLDKKYKLVSEVLEELQPLIKKNLEDDEENATQKGAFITAYYNFYLASAYYGLERLEEALMYYDKAGKFFLRGSSILNEINEISRRIREKIEERDKDKPKVFAPAKTTTFEEDVQAYNLQRIDFEDHYYGSGEVKSAYVGFQNFDDAYKFCRMNHKRLEVLKMNDGKWQRTGNIPTENLYYSNLKMDEGFKCYAYESSINEDLRKQTELLGNNKELIEQVTENAEKAKTILK
jgi:clan AA aspartic protease (TIGR02281 family)